MAGRSAKRVSVGLGGVLSAVVLGAPASLAGDPIGTANTVHPDVSGGGSTIKNGDGVTQGELIKSGPNGSTKIGFTDGTSLSIGSSAQVTLSHFVFNDKKTFKKASFDLGKGVFRFVTGSSDKSAYEIKTPTSTISVRGTVFTVTVTEDSTTVDVENGSVDQSGGQSGGQAGGPGGDQSLGHTFTTVQVESGSVSFCQGSSCQTVDAGHSANDRGSSKNSNNSDQNHQNTPQPTFLSPYNPPRIDECASPACADKH